MMQWQQLLSERRIGSVRGEQCNVSSRSEFERDYDRLVFSPAFRRLQNKTQVFPLPGTIFVHNRLTHSLEVSCVGRSLGNIIGSVLQKRYPKICNIDFKDAISSIVSAGCLAHDMGNPPFGHSGERAISAYFREGNGRQWQTEVEQEGGRWSDFLYFEGNANALRLLTHQFLGRRLGGFALTYSTVASIIKYPYSSALADGKPKFGFFQSEEATMQDIAEELGIIRLSEEGSELHYARYPLVYLVEAADDICYQIMDIEDACKLSILSYSEAEDLLLAFLKTSEQEKIFKSLGQIDDRNERIGYLRSRAINSLVEEVAGIFLDNEQNILRGTYHQSLITELGQQSSQAYRQSSQTAWNRIYCSKLVLDVELSGHQIFSSLLDKLLLALAQPEYSYSQVLLKRLSSQYDTNQTTTYGRIQCALDYISGMTDLYALDLYRRITGMNLSLQ